MSNMAGPEVWHRHRKKICYFEWSPPWHYFGIVSDISCGSIYGIYFLAFYLTFYSGSLFWHSILAFYLASFWHPIRHPSWPLFWHFLWRSTRQFFWKPTWHLFWHSFRHLFWHSIWRSILEARQCPLRSGACSAHWDLEPAVEARQCPLRSGPCSWGKEVEEEQVETLTWQVGKNRPVEGSFGPVFWAWPNQNWNSPKPRRIVRENIGRRAIPFKRHLGWCGDAVMWWCSDVVMWWCSDVVMWWCGDMMMWCCGDVVMWWCDDVWWFCDVVMWWCLWCDDVTMVVCGFLHFLENPYNGARTSKLPLPNAHILRETCFLYIVEVRVYIYIYLYIYIYIYTRTHREYMYTILFNGTQGVIVLVSLFGQIAFINKPRLALHFLRRFLSELLYAPFCAKVGVVLPLLFGCVAWRVFGFSLYPCLSLPESGSTLLQHGNRVCMCMSSLSLVSVSILKRVQTLYWCMHRCQSIYR